MDLTPFSSIAKGSLAKLQTQLEIAHEIEYLDEQTLNELEEKCQVIGQTLGSLIKARIDKEKK
jgi:four helix bundle protein